MKIIAAFAFLALASAKPEVPNVAEPLVASPYAETVKIAAPFEGEVPTSADSVQDVQVEDQKSYKDIPAANPSFDPNVPILRSNVIFKTTVVVNSVDENPRPQYQSPIDIGMIFVPEEVMRAIAAADATNAERVPLFPAFMHENENLAVKVAESPMQSEKILRATPSEFEIVRIAEAPEETVQVQPVVLAEPVMPVVESKDPMEPEKYIKVAPSELEAVRIAEAPQLEMQVPAIPFGESEDNIAVKVVDFPMEADQISMVAPSELEAVRVVEAPVEVEQPKQFVNIAELPIVLQNKNRPYRVYNNPLLR